MKFCIGCLVIQDVESHPARGAWIEMLYCAQRSWMTCSRTPQGVRGLKSTGYFFTASPPIVAPRKGCVD